MERFPHSLNKGRITRKVKKLQHIFLAGINAKLKKDAALYIACETLKRWRILRIVLLETNIQKKYKYLQTCIVCKSPAYAELVKFHATRNKTASKTERNVETNIERKIF